MRSRPATPLGTIGAGSSSSGSIFDHGLGDEWSRVQLRQELLRVLEWPPCKIDREVGGGRDQRAVAIFELERHVALPVVAVDAHARVRVDAVDHQCVIGLGLRHKRNV